MRTKKDIFSEEEKKLFKKIYHKGLKKSTLIEGTNKLWRTEIHKKIIFDNEFQIKNDKKNVWNDKLRTFIVCDIYFSKKKIKQEIKFKNVYRGAKYRVATVNISCK